VKSLTHIDALFPKPRKDRLRASANCTVLTLENQTNLVAVIGEQRQISLRSGTYRTSFCGIQWGGIAGKKRNDDTSTPWSTFLVGPDDSIHQSISNSVLYLHAVHDCGSNKELVFDIDKVV
jgi:hypothetical protein